MVSMFGIAQLENSLTVTSDVFGQGRLSVAQATVLRSALAASGATQLSSSVSVTG